MNTAFLRDFLFWCAVLNYGILLLWVVLYVFATRLLQPLTSRFYRISPAQSDTIQFAGIIFYKMAIWMLFIVPYIALRIME